MKNIFLIEKSGLTIRNVSDILRVAVIQGASARAGSTAFSGVKSIEITGLNTSGLMNFISGDR